MMLRAASRRVGTRPSARCLRVVHGVWSRHLSTAARVLDFATPADLKQKAPISERGNVMLVEKSLSLRPLAPLQRLQVNAENIFAASNDPLQHTDADLGRYWQPLGDGVSAFTDVFYHTGFCGRGAEMRELKTGAMMVRRQGLRLRDTLLKLEATNRLGGASAFILSGDRGCGKSSTLNYAIASCHEAGWLTVVIPSANDWTLGLGATSVQCPNEAYRLADKEYFKEMSPVLDGTKLYDNVDASTAFLLATALSQRSKLEKIVIKDAERKAYYAPNAADAANGPTLADLLDQVVGDGFGHFSDFPAPQRPIHDFLSELQLVTEMPVLLAIDGWNVWDKMASSCVWGDPSTPLHASQLLVPHMLGTLDYGQQMANGLMVCALSHSMPSASIPKPMRKKFPPPTDWRSVHSLPADVRRRMVSVPPYSHDELSQCLGYYALAGHLRNHRLQEQLGSGELVRKTAIMTSRVPEDVYKICEIM